MTRQMMQYLKHRVGALVEEGMPENLVLEIQDLIEEYVEDENDKRNRMVATAHKP